MQFHHCSTVALQCCIVITVTVDIPQHCQGDRGSVSITGQKEMQYWPERVLYFNILQGKKLLSGYNFLNLQLLYYNTYKADTHYCLSLTVALMENLGSCKWLEVTRQWLQLLNPHVVSTYNIPGAGVKWGQWIDTVPIHRGLALERSKFNENY